ncbi:invasion associated locus B family protein [Sulfitobacter sp. JB4-11]|uniref:invasion associated locus B family protein n=1 Tax=Sulfitobacter rhodophyticola TaxID=3238304 RepID=UPI003511B3FD
MSMTLKTLTIAAALAVMTPMWTMAQSTDTQTEAESETGATNGIESQLSLGEDADKDPDLGQPYTAEIIGAWEVRCIKTEAEEDPCQMYQLLDDGEGAPVAEVSLFRLPDGGKAKAGGTIVVPLETSLTDQMTIAIDGGKGRRYPFAFCNPVGCYARMGLTEADVSAYKRGNAAVITIVPALAPDQKVTLNLSLEGFTASYDKVSVIQP